MDRLKKIIALLLLLSIILGFSGALSGNTFKNTQKTGFIEQSINYGDYEKIHYTITNWSKLRPLQDSNETEQGMYLCLIAADMLEYGMTIDAYLAYLDEKGLNYVREEEIVPTTDGELIANYLYFTPRIRLTVEGDPITYAAISMDSPFEIPHGTSITYDLSNTSTPYYVMTDDGSILPESEYTLDETP